MAKDDTNAGDNWARWVNAQFDSPAGRGVAQFELAKAVGVGNSAVSKWRKGAHPADADAAVRAAKYFRRPVHEALRAAGHDELADLLDPAAVGIPETEDPIAEEIMGWTHLGLKVRQALLEQYRADLNAAIEAALSRARATAELLKAQRDGA